MTDEQLKQMYIDTEHGVFTPIYTYEDYNFGDGMYTNIIIVKTAEEVYQEWLANKDNPPVPKPTLGEQLEEANKRSVFLEAGVAELAKHIAKNTLLK